MLTMGPGTEFSVASVFSAFYWYISFSIIAPTRLVSLRVTMFQPTPTLKHIHLFSAVQASTSQQAQFSFLGASYLSNPHSPISSLLLYSLMRGHFLNSCCVCFIFQENTTNYKFKDFFNLTDTSLYLSTQWHGIFSLQDHNETRAWPFLTLRTIKAPMNLLLTLGLYAQHRIFRVVRSSMRVSLKQNRIWDKSWEKFMTNFKPSMYVTGFVIQ